MGMLAKIRRMYFRDKLSLREIAKRSGFSRNTLRRWLRQEDVVEPVYPARVTRSILDPYRERLEAWLRSDSHRPKRDRRTARVLFQHLQAQGYPGGYGRVAAAVRRWHIDGGTIPHRSAFVPLRFGPGEALTGFAVEKHFSSTGVASTPSSAGCASAWRWRTQSWPRAGRSW